MLVLTTAVVLLNPMSTGAADCSAERARVDELAKQAAGFNNELQAALRALDRAQRDMSADLDKITDTQNKLAAEPALVDQEMRSKGAWEALKILGPKVAFSVAIALSTQEAYYKCLDINPPQRCASPTAGGIGQCR